MDPSDFPDSDEEFDFINTNIGAKNVNQQPTGKTAVIHSSVLNKHVPQSKLRNSDFPDSDEEFDLIGNNFAGQSSNHESNGKGAVNKSTSDKQSKSKNAEFPDSDEEFDLIGNNFAGQSSNHESNGTKTVVSKSSSDKQKSQAQSKNAEFPDSDEEFEPIGSKSKATNHRSTDKKRAVDKPTPYKHISSPSTSKNTEYPGSDEEIDFTPLITGSSSDWSKKRNYDQVLADDEFNFDDLDFPDRKEKKLRWDRPEEVIEAINAMKVKKNKESETISCHRGSKRETITLSVPSWNFVALTRDEDAQRIYIRVRPEMKNRFDDTKKRPVSGLLSVSYSQLKAEAEGIIIENVKKASLASISLPGGAKENSDTDDQLWVDKYRPKSYIELLSEEGVNCALLYWIKLWDKVVFNREVKMSKKRMQMAMKWFSGGSKMKNKDNNEEAELIDRRGFPIQRIALLTGPPGLGKTTLAHLVAKQAGYNVVEINASNDRNPEAFRQALLSSTQMRPLMGTGDDIARPNCLVFDEIDGAPTSSIELLLQFVQGKLSTKGKKKSGKENEFCKRPVICICNELYTPALRSLRTMAFVINVPKVSPNALSNRLQTIARREKINVDKGALKDLADKSGCDIRSCLGALQYMGHDVTKKNASLGTKDTKIGLFDAWREILQIPNITSGRVSNNERVQRILRIARDDNSERFAVGVFENYPQNCWDDFEMINDALAWFPFYDEVSTMVREKQDWRVMPYTNFAFVAWHMGFALPRNPKLNFPYAAGEATQQLSKSNAVLSVARKHCGEDSRTLLLDIAPFMFELLTPRLRALAGHLLSPKEKAELQRLVNVMLDYGLTFVPDRNQEDGTLDFVLEPDLFSVGNFPDCKVRRGLPYAVKQIVLRELEYERVNRETNGGKKSNVDRELETQNNPVIKAPVEVTDTSGPTRKPSRPIHLKDMEKIIVPIKKKMTGDMFDSFFKKPSSTPSQVDAVSRRKETSPLKVRLDLKYRNIIKKHGVHYKYKEGFSNAIRRNVKMQDVL